MEEAKKPAAKGILMTEGPIARQILAFTLPLLLGNVFQQLYNTVDSVVVAILWEKKRWRRWAAPLP